MWIKCPGKTWNFEKLNVQNKGEKKSIKKDTAEEGRKGTVLKSCRDFGNIGIEVVSMGILRGNFIVEGSEGGFYSGNKIKWKGKQNFSGILTKKGADFYF